MKSVFILLVLLLLYNINGFTFEKNYFPLGFYENKGQIIDQKGNPNPTVKYLFTSNGFKVQLKKNSFSYEILKTVVTKRKVVLTNRKLISKYKLDDSCTIFSHRIDIELVGANPNPTIIANEKSNDYDNYYTTGTQEEGVTYVYRYNKVVYKDIYHNIDLEFLIDIKNKQPFKYNFIVHPNGNLADIRLHYGGAKGIKLNNNGNINIVTANGNFEESIPKSYELETKRKINVYYLHLQNGTYGFSTSSYHTQSTLVVDPWCTYYGNNLGDGAGFYIKSDFYNNVVATGGTTSTNNIASTNAFQTVYNGNTDAFLVKFSMLGIRLWGTYYGGSGGDYGNSLGVDINSNIVLHGFTSSTTNISTSGAFQTVFVSNQGSNGLLARFNGNGIRQWGTYYGGSSVSGTNGYGLALDSAGNIFVTGETGSSTNIATVGTYQSTFPINGGGGYIIKFDTTGARHWGTYVLNCQGNSLVVSNSGSIYFTGYTYSNTGIATTGCFQPIFGGSVDAVIAKFNSTGSQLFWRTYYGGSGDENEAIGSIIIDSSNLVYISGVSTSSNNIASSNANQTLLMGYVDGFLAKFDTLGNRVWGTYVGGNDNDFVYDASIDNSGYILLTGFTQSTNGIASIGAFQPYLIGSSDAFIMKFNTSGTKILGTYFGGTNNSSQNEYANAVTVDGLGNIVITGLTNATSNISTSGAFQTTPAKIFIASFDSTGNIPVTNLVTNNTITSAQTICSNVQPALLTGSTPSGGSGTFGYLWLQSTTSATSGFIAASGANNTQNYQPSLLSVTTWYKRVVMSGNAVDTSAAVQITVNAAPVASITAGGATAFCQGASVTLNANTGAGFNYQWYEGSNTISGATNATYLAATGGSYTVLISNSNNCTDTSNAITVTVNPVPTASIAAGGNTTICNGEGVNLNAQTATGYSYQWYNGNSILTGATNATYLANTSGSYTVMVDLGSCSDTSNAIVVTVNALPSVIITQTVDTFYSNGSFNTYQWYLNGTAIAGATNPNYTATQNGNYYVMVTDANNCSGQSNTILFTVGIDEVDGGHLFSVSPNPFKESFVVKCASAKGSLMIVDIVGKVVKSVVIKSVITTIDMKGYAAGVYLVKYENKGAIETVKVVKE